MTNPLTKELADAIREMVNHRDVLGDAASTLCSIRLMGLKALARYDAAQAAQGPAQQLDTREREWAAAWEWASHPQDGTRRLLCANEAEADAVIKYETKCDMPRPLRKQWRFKAGPWNEVKSVVDADTPSAGEPAEMKTCKCGQPSDGWPGDGMEDLCQMCWEKYCDESFWSQWNARGTVLSAGDPKP